MAAPVDKSLVDCYWFITSQCTKGETCEYRHCEAAKNNTTMCKFWPTGQCTNKTCFFRHPSQVRTTTPCVFFLAGMCTKGDKCPYVHVLPNEAAPAVTPQETVSQQKLETANEQNKQLQKEAKPKQTKVSVPPASKPTTTDQKQKQNDSSQTKEQKQKQSIKNIVKASVAGNNNNDGKKVIGKKASAPPTQPAKQTTAPKQQTAQAAKAKASKVPVKTEAQPNFGIKSLDELLKEKVQDKPAETKQENIKDNNTTNNVVTNIDEIRKRNQQKFHTQNNASQNTATKSPDVSGVKRKAETINNNTPAATQPATTPSKDLKSSQDAIKKPKTTDTIPQQSTNADPTEDFDLDKELEQLGAEGLNDVDLDIDNIDVDNVDLDAIET